MESNFKKAWKIVSPIIIYLVIERIIGFCVNFYYIWGHLDEDTIWTEELEDQLYLQVYDMQLNNTVLIAGIVAIISILIFYRMFRKECLKRPYRIEMTQPAAVKYIYVTAIAIGFTIAINLGINAYGIFKYDWDFAKVAQLIYTEPLYLQFLVIGIIVPVCEELLFRGVIYERISQSGSARSAMILTSILFAFFHGTWMQILYAFVFSLIMIYSYQRCGTFKAPIYLHIVSNCSSLVLRQFPPFSSMGYSIGIVSFALIGIFGIYMLKQGTFYHTISLNNTLDDVY